MGKKKEEKTVSVGKEDLTEKAAELKTAHMVATEAQGQIMDFLEQWEEKIYDTYKKSGNELSISFSVKLKGDSQAVKVDTTMSFTTGKITEKTEGEVTIAPKLPFEGEEKK